MPRGDFDLRALYEALDEQRRARQMSWTAAAQEINRFRTTLRPIGVSTITGLKDKPRAEGDGVLQMLLWLGRTPESFVPGRSVADDERCRLPQLKMGQILRWDTKALHAALDSERRARGLTWAGVADQLSGFTAGMLTDLAKGGRIGFPRVMRLTAWLGQPAVTFTRIAAW
jgi:hypothetical protein